MLTSTISPLLKTLFGWIGMWPGAPHATLCWLFFMTTLVAMQYLQYSYVYAHLDNLTKLMDGLGLTLDYTLTIFKLLSLWFNRRIFADILRLMDDDWNECVIKLHECLMMEKANLAHRCSSVMISLNVLATVLFFIDSRVRRRTVSEDGRFREFPVQVQFPFEVRESPTFELVIVGLFFHVLETATVVAMLNSLILTLIINILVVLFECRLKTLSFYFEVLHVSGQIDIMCLELKELSSMPKSLTTKSLVARHQKIIMLSSNIEDYFSFVGLLQFVWNTLVICSLGFMAVISLGMNMESKSGILIQFIIPYLAVTIEAFVFCYAGEHLKTKSKSLGDAAYEATWYDLSISECRILLLLILRSQKRLTITAGKVMDLTLESFTTVMKASASYISVLHAMY